MQSKSQNAPICLFVYNRPFHTEQTIKHLRENHLASDSELIVFSDGPKDKKGAVKVKEVRSIVHSITGFKKTHVIERESNYGLSKSIIEGVTQVINEYGRVIVVEDDLITSPYFLEYMNQGLRLYSDDQTVASIHGYVYPVATELPETFFIKGADCWGWATWKRAWDHFEPDGRKLLKKLKENNLTREFNFNNSYPYTRMLKNQIKGKNNSWAIRWYASAFLQNMLTLYPYPSLVKNIGFDNSGTHSGISGIFTGNLHSGPIEIRKTEVTENMLVRKSFEKFFRKRKNICNLTIRIYSKIVGLLSR